MVKKTEKLKHGEASLYYSRNQAVRKLQLTLAQFRRLCILKGIYPVEPSNKKIMKKSTKLQTFYYKKDIKYLLHEPLLETVREEVIFNRKLGKLNAKKELKQIEQLVDQKPIFKLDHLVKERYPTFEDALRDLDDCLSMVALFATLSTDVVENSKSISDSQRLMSEFLEFVVETRSLRKCFLSIKGIYYQAVIKGITITWIAPYQFSIETPHDVDFKVMNTFLDFHLTLLGFVNYKLHADYGLQYPPVSKTPEIVAKKMVSKKIQAKVDSVPISQEESESAPAEEETFETENIGSSDIFQNHIFFIAREVPLYLTKFIINSQGGIAGWSELAGLGSPIAENDSRITIVITDRPTVANPIQGREYLQPQWLYDCVNAGAILKTAGYHPGEKLPPHLSPFVIAGEDDYSPTEEPKETTVKEQEPEIIEEKEEEIVEDKDLKKLMMSKRNRKLYEKIQFGKKRKQEAAGKLREKRSQLNK